MYSLKFSSHFKKDLRKFQHNKQVLNTLEEILDILVLGHKLPPKYLNHSLSGEFLHCFECHVKPDVLLIYKIEKTELLILLLRVGSHSTLF